MRRSFKSWLRYNFFFWIMFQVDQLVLEELVREKFPKLGLSLVVILSSCFFSVDNASTWCFNPINLWLDNLAVILWFHSTSLYVAVNHLDYLGVQVAWVTGPWFLSIFMNMLPWESGQVLCFIVLYLCRSLYVEVVGMCLSAILMPSSYETSLLILLISLEVQCHMRAWAW